jgi:adhesin transport system outer membrane protein
LHTTVQAENRAPRWPCHHATTPGKLFTDTMNLTSYQMMATPLLLAAWFAHSPALAQTTSPTSVKTATERAITQNPEVLFKFNQFKAALQEQREAEGSRYPRVDLEAGGGSYSAKTPGSASTINYDGSRALLQLRQVLFDGFVSRNEVRRLSYAAQAAYYDVLSTSNNIALDTVKAYIDVLRFRELVSLAEENFNTHLAVNDKLAQKVKAGVGRRVDLEQAGGRLALAESNWVTEVSNLHDVSARYQRLVGDTPAENLARLDPLDAYLPVGSEFLKEAVPKNPDFLAAVATIRSYRADAEVRKGPNYPTLELRARQGFETNRSGTTGDYHDTALELVLNYNLYRGGGDQARIKQYAAKLASAFDLRDKACRDIWQTGQIAFNDSKRLGNQLKLLSQHEISTSKAKQAYQQQFDIGQRTLLDLLDTENELYQARRALVNAEFDLQFSEARVLATSGELLKSLKLQAILSDLPDAAGSAHEDDPLLRCNDRILPQPTLNRTFASAQVEAPRAPAEPLPAATPAPTPQPAPAASAPVPDKACAAISPSIQAWISAWNAKDLGGYLSHYSDKFAPAMGLSRSQWEALRKKRVGKQGDINAVIRNIQIPQCQDHAAQATFSQEYGSSDYRDSVEKTLSLEWINGQWKIVKEAVTKGRTF